MKPELPARTLAAAEVRGLLAHRYPFLLVDTIAVDEPGRRATGRKRVSGGEWFGLAMPGLLVVEALAQTAAAVLTDLVDGPEGAIGYFAAMERVRFRHPARAGDTLALAVELRQFRRGVAKLRGAATSERGLVASADFTTVVRALPQANHSAP